MLNRFAHSRIITDDQCPVITDILFNILGETTSKDHNDTVQIVEIVPRPVPTDQKPLLGLSGRSVPSRRISSEIESSNDRFTQHSQLEPTSLKNKSYCIISPESIERNITKPFIGTQQLITYNNNGPVYPILETLSDIQGRVPIYSDSSDHCRNSEHIELNDLPEPLLSITSSEPIKSNKTELSNNSSDWFQSMMEEVDRRDIASARNAFGNPLPRSANNPIIEQRAMSDTHKNTIPQNHTKRKSMIFDKQHLISNNIEREPLTGKITGKNELKRSDRENIERSSLVPGQLGITDFTPLRSLDGVNKSILEILNGIDSHMNDQVMEDHMNDQVMEDQVMEDHMKENQVMENHMKENQLMEDIEIHLVAPIIPDMIASTPLRSILKPIRSSHTEPVPEPLLLPDFTSTIDLDSIAHIRELKNKFT
jgi:hypothetical protein